MALLLTRRDVASLLTMAETIDCVEQAFRELALGNVTMPQRAAIRFPEHRAVHLTMPAYLAGQAKALAVKVVTVFPDNPARHQLPTTMALLLLDDPETGAPLAVMDAGYLTAMRTGAVSGVATRHLARPNARTVGVFGGGVQARTQLMAAAAVRPIVSAAVYDTDAARAKTFAAEMTDTLGFPVVPVPNARAAVQGQDIVAIATSATEPILDGRWLAPGQHINAIGSHAPAHRELDTATVVRSKVFPDLREACLAEAGDFLIPMKEGAITADHLRAGLGEVVAGLKPGRESDDEITLFKSVGLALQDAATASLVYNKARCAKVGVEFAF